MMTNEEKYEELKNTMTEEEYHEAYALAASSGRKAWMILRSGNSLPPNKPWSELTEAEQFFFGSAIHGIVAMEKERAREAAFGGRGRVKPFDPMATLRLEPIDPSELMKAASFDGAPRAETYDPGIQPAHTSPFDPASILG